MELYKKHRPKLIKHLIGQPNAVNQLNDWLRNSTTPHAIILTGGTGTEKTTTARILAKKLECGETDYFEIDCGAVDKPIETVRGIKSRMGLSPIGGKCRIWLLDEVQTLSRAKFAAQALLKILEDTPEHVYFILATTEPHKVIAAVRNRCQEIKFLPIKASELTALVQSVLEKEEKELSQEVVSRIVENANGSARGALVLLEQVIDLKDKKEQLAILHSEDLQGQAFDIAKALIYTRPKWPEMVEILKSVDTSDPEKLRHFILACATTELLKANKNSDKAYVVLSIFGENWFDKSKSGLVESCYTVLHS